MFRYGVPSRIAFGLGITKATSVALAREDRQRACSRPRPVMGVAARTGSARLVLVEFNPDFCRLLGKRFPTATVLQGDAYRLRRLMQDVLKEPAAAVVSSLPLLTKPLRTRLRLTADVMALIAPHAPFVQFTYGMLPPIPKALGGIKAEASNVIWMNLPPARVWVYRGER